VAAAFPACQHPEWCDTPYVDDTAAAQAALHAHHNPPDCDGARYLVVTGEWVSGLGSTMHIHAYTLALATSDNRVLVLDPAMGWPYASSPSLCDCAAVGAPCGDGTTSTLTNMDCLFVPASRCPPPPNWRAAPRWRLGAPDRVMQADSVSEVAGISQCEASVQVGGGAGSPLARFADRPPSWWQAQLIAYITRPRPSTLARILAPAMANAFWNTGGIPPRPLASVFMRGGDKGAEAALQPGGAYFDALAPVAAALNVTHVYLSSDDGALIHAAIDGYASSRRGAPASPPPRYTPHFIDWHRPTGGATFAELMSWAGSWRMDQLVRLAVADFYITAMADAAAGTLSSNWCRAPDALRRAAGRGRVPYATPEGTLYYSVCENVEDGAREHGKHVADWPAMTAVLRGATPGSWEG
jgi:hypothetical protein